jgi:WD40 repeat protein/Ca2+-binding EF-hand superfamily protein
MPAPAEEPKKSEANALNLRAVFGFNKDIPAGVHDLTDVNRQAVLCASAHTAIIYDYENRTQMLLQGHCNAISATCVSADKKFIVTADKGEDSMVIIWNAKTGVPLRSIFNPHVGGVAAIDMTPDATLIATLSAPITSDEPQEVSIWEWSVDSEKPKWQGSVTATDMQLIVRFNPAKPTQLVTNGMNRVIFWNCEGDALKFYSPPISKRDFKQPVGMFTQSVFLPETTQAVSATVDGDVVLWDQALLPEQHSKVTDKRAVKIVRLHKKAIRFITTFGRFFVTGADDGFVRFFDFKFRALAWYEDLASGPIASISFTSFLKPEIDDSETMRVPNFVVATANSLVLLVNAAVFELLDEEQRRGEVIIQGQDSAIHAIAAHPEAPQFALASDSGSVQIWDYEQQALMVFAKYEKLSGTCCSFDPKGELLAVGFANGGIKILNSETLQELHNFKYNKSGVVHCAFSHDCAYLATSDQDFCIAIYRCECVIDFGCIVLCLSTRRSPSKKKNRYELKGGDVDENGEPIEPTEDWAYLGRIKSHSKRISALLFGKYPDGTPQLRSVAEDRRIVEYDLASSFVSTGIVSKNYAMIDHVSYPTAAVLLRPVFGDGQERVVTANDFYKFKVFDFTGRQGFQEHSDMANCYQTLLGPTYGGPIQQMMLVENEGQSYLAYGTANKVVGLVKLPLDGNPNKTMALIAHPGEISSMCTTFDGKYLLTAGGSDYTVNLWQIQPAALEAAAILGGEGQTPYLNLIEGGESGEFYDEIKDFFVYAQLRSQGEDSTEQRHITGEVPLELVPDLMRALGFYPSQHQVADMLFELKYLRYDRTGQTNSSINLEDFILIYVNHRPVHGLNQAQISEAFTALGADEVAGLIDINTLLNSLKHSGETFTEQELVLVLENLVGDSDLRHRLGQNEMNAVDFAELVLGFDGGEAAEVEPAEEEQPPAADTPVE